MRPISESALEIVSERPSAVQETFSSAKKVSLPLETCDDEADATALTKGLACVWRRVVREKGRGLNTEGKVGLRKWEKKW